MKRPVSRLLWVDDDAFHIQPSAEFISSRTQILIDFASDLETAVEKLKETRYDLIISDLIMCGASYRPSDVAYEGLKLYQSLRAGAIDSLHLRSESWYQSIPFVVLTVAESTAQTAFKGSDPHMTVVAKPCSPSTLVRLINRMIKEAA